MNKIITNDNTKNIMRMNAGNNPSKVDISTPINVTIANPNAPNSCLFLPNTVTPKKMTARAIAKPPSIEAQVGMFVESCENIKSILPDISEPPHN